MNDFQDLPGPEELQGLDECFVPQTGEKVRMSFDPSIRVDGLVAGSCGPLSRTPEPGSPGPFRGTWGGEHLVGYGFFAPEGDRRGRWQFSTEQPFRATKIYAWGWNGETAAISSLLFGADEQLDSDHPVPADLFASCVSPKQFLELYAGIENPAAGNHRVLCKHLPGQPCFAVTLDFPTLSLGGAFEVAWTGPLHAFFVCGRELLEKGNRGTGFLGSDPDPDPGKGLDGSERSSAGHCP